MTISPCGADCAACGRFPAQCAGCSAIAGKVWWLQFANMDCCPVYACCVEKKGPRTCGSCPELPCERFMRDPTVSEEENNAHLQIMLQNLKEL